jgi:LysM repeat protein
VKFYRKQKYSIAKQYKITVAELDAANPILERSFKIGQKIIIQKKKIMYPLLLSKEMKEEVMLKETIVAYKPSLNDAVTILSQLLMVAI